jgi:hypothetical protein
MRLLQWRIIYLCVRTEPSSLSALLRFSLQVGRYDAAIGVAQMALQPKKGTKTEVRALGTRDDWTIAWHGPHAASEAIWASIIIVKHLGFPTLFNRAASSALAM